MIVLGLNHGEINSSAAIVRDGRVLAGSAEERFNRQKRSKAVPRRSIEYCLAEAGVTLDQCDAIAQAWNPGAGWHKLNPMISGARTRREEYFYSAPDNLPGMTGRCPTDWVRMEFDPTCGLAPVHYVQHHRAHAANDFFLSPFEDAAILTCDFRGEFECTTFAHGQGNRIELLQCQQVPHSLGIFHAAFTEFLGYRPAAFYDYYRSYVTKGDGNQDRPNP